MNRSRRAGIEDVARLAGVSIATVSRVLNGTAHRAAHATAERVRLVAGELDYRPAHAGRALRTQTTRLVALMVPDTINAFYAAIAKSIESSLAERDYATILCNTGEDPAVQDAYLVEMRAHGVRGVALLGAVPSDGLRAAVAAGMPIAFVNRRSPVEPGLFVGIDNTAAGRAVADHFIAQSYRDCSVIHGPLRSPASRGRYEGYRDRLAEVGWPLSEARTQSADLTMQDGYRAACELFDRATVPRAVFCGNDQIAYGLFRRCRELRLQVPSKLAIFGFDDNPLNEWLAPWLSTVHVPSEAFGPAVIAMLERLWQGGTPLADETLLTYSLMLRGSAE